MSDHDQPNSAATNPRWRPSRRGLLKAGAAAAAVAAVGAVGDFAAAPVHAEGGILHQRWSAADNQGVRAASADGWQIAKCDFRFYAIGSSWGGSVGYWPTLELSFSDDGANWSSSSLTSADVEDGGRPDRDGRVFAKLVFLDGATYARFRTLDGNGAPANVSGVQLFFIDATGGPHFGGVSAASLPALQKPTIISRSGWGCPDPNGARDSYGLIWPPEYQTVEHVIIHHADTPNYQDGGPAVRSIYEYHTWDRGWGDIGYNYLVDYQGNIYEGRFGGTNVVGGHAYQYAFGSSGICAVGTFNTVDVTSAQKTSLVNITAWAGRALDPLGKSDFHSVRALPTISGHRDTNQTECPGDVLYSDLPSIRSRVASILGSTSHTDPGTPGPGPKFKTGDNVIFLTDTNLYNNISTSSGVVFTAKAGAYGGIDGAYRTDSNGQQWQAVRTFNSSTHTSAHLIEGYCYPTRLDFAPVGDPPAPKYEEGDVVKALQDMDLRRSAGEAQNSPYYLYQGDILNVSGPCVAATGSQWVTVDGPQNATGYVKQETVALVRSRAFSVSPSSGDVGATATASVSGMPTNRTITISIGGVKAKSIVTNGSGSGSVNFTIPNVPAGKQTATATVGVVSLSANFTVTGGGSPTPTPPDFSGSYPLVGGSSSSDSQNSSRIRDRNFNSYWRTNNTGTKSSAWVSADLGSVKSIGDVRWVMGATGMAKAFTVQVSSDNVSWTDIGAGTDSGVMELKSVTAPNGTTGRWVRFAFTNPNQTPTLGGLAEVAVYPGTGGGNGSPTPTPPDFSGRYAMVGGGQSSDSQSNSRVRDGDFSSYWRTNNTGIKSSAYVYVDLGSVKSIGEVRWVMGVTGMAGAFDIQITTDKSSWQTITSGTDSPAGEAQSYTLPVPMDGRYVLFAFTNPNSTPTLGGIAEIGVFPGPNPGGQGGGSETPTTTPTPDLSGSYPLVSGGSSPDSQSNTRVRDRNFDSYWRTNNTGVKSSGYVYVDLGDVKPIGEIRWWMGATGMANDFSIEVSPDRATWTEVGTGTDAPVGEQQSQVIADGINGRYVRFFFRNPNSTPTLGGIAEIAVYPGTVKVNSAAASPTPSPSATGTPVPTETPTETPVPTETGTPVPTETPTETPVSTETPSPTETPVPTETPTDTPTDADAGNASAAEATP
jgi:hypothetical protein